MSIHCRPPKRLAIKRDAQPPNSNASRLTWNVGVYPHWTCHDASKPTQPAVSLGWWTNPFEG